VQVRIFQEPSQEKFLGAFQARFAQKENAEQQNHQHQPNSRSLHRGRSEPGKVAGDK
jgi:hypothetical protein